MKFLVTIEGDGIVTAKPYEEPRYSEVYFIELMDEYGSTIHQYMWHADSKESAIKYAARVFQGKKHRPTGGYIQKAYEVGHKEKFTIHPAIEILDY